MKMYLDLKTTFDIGEKCRMQVAKIAQLLVVVGYWTGRLLRKLRVREKYGLMVSVQRWRLNNLIFLTNLLVNFKRFF